MRMFMIWLLLFLMAATWIGCNRRDKSVASDALSNVATSSKSEPVESPVKILSAKRMERFVGSNNMMWKAKNAKREVVLVVEFTGISSEEWEKVPKEQVYLEAGGQRHNPSALEKVSVFTNGSWELNKVVLVAVVPRDVLEFDLHVGGLPMRTLKADTAIATTLSGTSPTGFLSRTEIQARRDS
jgi:hypothetical protein